MSAFRAVFWATVLAFALSFVRPETALVPAPAAGRAGGRRPRRAPGGGDHGGRGDRRRRRHPHRARPEARRPDRGARRRQRRPAPSLFAAARGLAARPRGAGDRVLHHGRGDDRAGAGAASASPAWPRTCSSSTTRCSPRSARPPRWRRSPPPRSPAATRSATTMLTWKYTLPAFLVPFAFTLEPRGMGLLLRAAAGRRAGVRRLRRPRRGRPGRRLRGMAARPRRPGRTRGWRRPPGCC